MWVHYIDLHWPYRLSRRKDQPKDLAQAWKDRQTYRRVMQSKGTYDPGEEVAQRWWTLYREEMLSVDENMQRIFEAVQEKGFWDQTAIALTGDHGEEFYERGTWAHSWNQLFDEGIQVPFILHLHGQTQAQRVHQQVSHLEIAPTLLALAQIEIPASMLGHSLLGYLNGSSPIEKTPIRQYALSEMLGHRNSYRYRMALRSENERYIYDFDKAKDKQFYQRSNDPNENHNLYDHHLPKARQFDHLRLDHLAPVVPEMMEEKVEDAFADLDPNVAERLRDLGYLS
jgi:arylsulfatase A-like enzyme